MNFTSILILVSIAWIISEIILARIKHSNTTSTQRDKSSLRILWLAIGFSIQTGILWSFTGIGRVAIGNNFLPVAGLVLILAGLLIRWLAILTLRKYFTVDVSISQDHLLVRRGLYRLVRHPAYSGSLLSFLGLALVFTNWISLLVIFMPILAAFLYRIKVEERALRTFFGETWTDYCHRTKRLIPGIY